MDCHPEKCAYVGDVEKKLAEAEARIKELEKYCCEVCHIRNVPSECENHCPVKIKRGRS